MLSKIFIASSSEGKQVAYDVQELLSDDAQCFVWANSFGPSRSTMETLMEWLDNADFGIFVFSPDDVLSFRGKEHVSARDNVVFESGLFIGRLGMTRNFILVPDGVENFKLPSDLLGITTLRYEPAPESGDLTQALGNPCNKIRKAVTSLGRKSLDAENFDQVAAFCVRESGGGREIAIVQTDSDRWMFPKGFRVRSEEAWLTAERAAYDLVGCRGEISKQPFVTFKHKKTTADHEILVGVYVLIVDETKEVELTFENVEWVSFDEVERYFAVGREPKYIRELSAVLEASKSLQF